MDADTLAAIREWVGSQPDDHTIELVYERKGSVEGAALSILRQRRADMLANPTDWAVEGEYRESTKANLAALDKQIGALERITGTDGSDAISVGRMVRCDTGR